MNKYIGKILP